MGWRRAILLGITAFSALAVLHCGGGDDSVQTDAPAVREHEQFKKAAVQLTVRSIRTTLSFYKDLGFESATYWPSSGVPLEATVRAGTVAIQLKSQEAIEETYPDLTPFPAPGAAMLVLTVNDIDQLFEEIKLGVTIIEEPHVKEPGLVEMTVLDPDGYYLILQERKGEKVSL